MHLFILFFSSLPPSLVICYPLLICQWLILMWLSSSSQICSRLSPWFSALFEVGLGRPWSNSSKSSIRFVVSLVSAVKLELFHDFFNVCWSEAWVRHSVKWRFNPKTNTTQLKRSERPSTLLKIRSHWLDFTWQMDESDCIIPGSTSHLARHQTSQCAFFTQKWGFQTSKKQG